MRVEILKKGMISIKIDKNIFHNKIKRKVGD